MLRKLDCHGYSILSVLFLIGISTLIISGLITMVLSQNKESKAVAELIQIKNFESAMIAALSDENVCSYTLDHHRFNTAQATAETPYIIDIGEKTIYTTMLSSSQPGAVLTKKGENIDSHSAIKIQSIKYEIYPGRIVGTTGLFYGRWVIAFNTEKAIRSHKPIILDSSLVVDVIDPSNAEVIKCVGYNQNSILSQSCPPGQAVVGYTSTGVIKCKNNYPETCPVGEVYSRTDSNGNIICIKQVQVGACPAGKVMTGIYNDSTPRCRDL